MKLKTSWLRISSDIIPHDSNDSVEDLDVVSKGIVEALENSNKEDFELDEKILIFTNIFTSRIIENLDSNISYYLGKWGGKYFSGDISASLGEAIAYAFLEQKFDIKITDILPLRQVKFQGIVTDTYLKIEKYPKIKEFLGAENGILFINTRSMMTYDKNLLSRNISKDLIISENLRYPDNYSLLSYLIGVNTLYLVVITP
ncbi:hypothetical protein DFR86_02690 [Acidianus sulfidivorans JP7]|uniref:hypothetical protein n=1 Tax=Acidianus sulfidivorans TaxID=312539 RepID=UPI0013A53FE8|nr:hypothetical protein [Acidianus sulfidivorans]AWR96562.2 hypothetical protein DFR86_02690 [Acidianus sulfidivorans JP7]